MNKKVNNYYRVLFHKVRDAVLITWLESERKPGERPGKAIRRKLYQLYKKDKERKATAKKAKKDAEATQNNE